eukprot:3103033-Amphidinium_carterae.1
MRSASMEDEVDAGQELSFSQVIVLLTSWLAWLGINLVVAAPGVLYSLVSDIPGFYSSSGVTSMVLQYGVST